MRTGSMLLRIFTEIAMCTQHSSCAFSIHPDNKHSKSEYRTVVPDKQPFTAYAVRKVLMQEQKIVAEVKIYFYADYLVKQGSSAKMEYHAFRHYSDSHTSQPECAARSQSPPCGRNQHQARTRIYRSRRTISAAPEAQSTFILLSLALIRFNRIKIRPHNRDSHYSQGSHRMRRHTRTSPAQCH